MKDKIPDIKWPTYRGGVGQIALRLCIVLLILALAYVWRPLAHPVVYRIAYSPGGLLAFGLPLLAALLLFLSPPLRSEKTTNTRHRSRSTSQKLGFDSATTKLTLFGGVIIGAVLLAIIVGGLGGMVEERTLATQTMEDSEEIKSLPAMNAENPRVVPRKVADVQTRGSVSYRQHRLGTSDIARMEDGRLAWSYSIEPNGFRNALYEHQRGVLMSDMTTMEDREMKAVDNQEFAVGEGMLLHRGADWNLKKSDYWAQYRDEPVEFVHDGTPYLAYPKTGHEWHLTPIPHTTPTWKGVALVHPDGTIEHLSPQEARNSEILEGQRLYPLYNTMREMESLDHRNGIINQLPVVGAHEKEVEVASMPSGAGNQQPFVIDLEGERMNYVTALEPFGEDTRGLDEVWFADARTGTYRYFGTGNETVFGPERAMGLVRSADSRTGWGDNFEVVEPVPVVIDGELWWHSKVVPTDNTDISRNSFANAHTGEVIELHNTESVEAFLAGEDVEPVDNVKTEPADDDEGTAYYIVIIGEDGTELDRIPIEDGQEVNIVQESGTTNNSTQNTTG